MNKHSNPLDALIDFSLSAGADKFWVNNAKDELKKLREKINTFVEHTIKPAAFAKINDHGDLYDLRLQNNPYNDQTKVIPLYRINHD